MFFAHYPLSVTLPTDLKHPGYMIFPLLAVLFLAWLWDRRLRRQVAQRTAELRESLEFQRSCKFDKERIEHLNRVLRAIRDVNQLIVRETDVQKLIDDACKLLVGNPGYTGAWLLLVDEEDRVTRYAQTNMDAAVLAAVVEKSALPPCCRHVDVDNPLHFIADPRICENCAVGSGCPEKRLWCACLRCDGRVYGYLAIQGDGMFVTDDEGNGLFVEMADDLGYAVHALAEHKARIEAEDERETMQRQLLHAQKMESVGRLAGGVAHDFNNLLMGIQNFAEMCRKQVEDESQIGKWLDEILATTRRSATLTRQLLAFASKQTTAPKILDLNHGVGNLLNLIRRLIGEDIDLVWLPGEALGPVEMDPGQLDQLLTNLCVNARDAIHGVGKITIGTTNVVIDDDYCAEHPDARPGTFVMLAIADDGCGMEPVVLEQIFEPFFTTKDSGDGTGLGLSMVYGIVKQNHGLVNVYSEAGHGTVFRLYFPTCEEARATAAPAASPMAGKAAVGGGESILLVEDEPTIRLTLSQFLDQQGYAVFAAETPEEALTIVDRRDAPFDLLITDVVMPGMNGRELASRLEATVPVMKCLFISGYTANAIAHRGILDPGIEFLSKPFSCAELKQKIQHILGTPKDSASRPEPNRQISEKNSAGR